MREEQPDESLAVRWGVEAYSEGILEDVGHDMSGHISEMIEKNQERHI